MLELGLPGGFEYRRSGRAIRLPPGAAAHHLARRCSGGHGPGAAGRARLRGRCGCGQGIPAGDSARDMDGPLVEERVEETAAVAGLWVVAGGVAERGHAVIRDSLEDAAHVRGNLRRLCGPGPMDQVD